MVAMSVSRLPPLTQQVWVLRRAAEPPSLGPRYMTVAFRSTAGGPTIASLCAFEDFAEGTLVGDALESHRASTGIWTPAEPAFELEIPLHAIGPGGRDRPLGEGVALHPLPLARAIGTARAMALDVVLVPRVHVDRGVLRAPLEHFPVAPRGPVEPRRVLDLCWLLPPHLE